MSEDEIIRLMLQVDMLKLALIRIAEFNAAQYNGYEDEWEAAHAFSDCQVIALEALVNVNNL